MLKIHLQCNILFLSCVIDFIKGSSYLNSLPQSPDTQVFSPSCLILTRGPRELEHGKTLKENIQLGETVLNVNFLFQNLSNTLRRKRSFANLLVE